MRKKLYRGKSLETKKKNSLKNAFDFLIPSHFIIQAFFNRLQRSQLPTPYLSSFPNRNMKVNVKSGGRFVSFSKG